MLVGSSCPKGTMAYYSPAARDDDEGAAAVIPAAAIERAAAPRGRVLAGRLPRDTVYRRALGAADVVATGLTLVVVVHLVDGHGIGPAAAALLPVGVLLSKMLGLYEHDALRLHRSTLNEVPSVFQLATLMTIVIWLAQDLLVTGELGSSQFVGLWAALFAATILARAVARRVAGRLTEPERCLVIGDPAGFQGIRRKLELSHGSDTTVAFGVAAGGEEHDALLTGGLRALVEAHAIDRVIIAPETMDSGPVLDLIREAQAIRVKASLLPRFSEVVGSAVVFDDLPGTALLAARQFGMSASSELMKRGFDVVATGLGLVVLAPVFAAIAVAVKLDSRGPVFIRQIRVGRGGRRFRMLKFRTMVRDADERKAALASLNEADGLFKIAADPRITRVGRRLRRSQLDELPQLLNVLRGEMSLVGPRPLIVEEDALIQGWHRERLNVPPGMTGHWQVLGGPRVPLGEMVAIDYLYAVNWSLWEDVKCILRTVPRVLGRHGL